MNPYASYTPEQTEELLSNFLIDSWSYSKVSLFARNEKEFERSAIYREQNKKSATAIAGSAYHKALEVYFSNLSQGVETSLVELEKAIYQYIDDVPANDWKLQKTTPTIETAKLSAVKTSTTLIGSFYKEKNIYLSDIKEIIGVELRCDQWLTINGVDIPLPCHGVIDLVVRLKNGHIAIIDHKTKTAYTDEKEISLAIGKQAITYIKCYEAQSGEKVSEVWFVENKSSRNTDGTPQLKKFKVKATKDTRRLWEALLYEPLKRMLEAVSDPDYVYMINDADNMTDKATLYDFWAKTMIAEISEFNVPENKQEVIEKRLKKIRDSSLSMVTPKVITTFKRNASQFIQYDFTYTDMKNTEKIEHVLRSFGAIVSVAHQIDGYSSDTYLLEVSAGVKIANIIKYRMDIANALNVPSVRIIKDLVIYQGKSYLAIEAPKKRTKDLLFDPKYLNGHRLPIGVDNYGNTIVWDIDNHSTPHMLICGATGSGKSVSILSTIEYARLAGVKDIVIFDPKHEFLKLKSSARVYNDIEQIEEQMKLLVDDMQKRVKTGDNHITLIVFDEFADAVASSRSGSQLDIIEDVQVGFYAPKRFMPPQPKFEKKVVGRLKSLEENLKILLQKGRSLGFRIISATQRASTKIITGDAKVNFPVQVCFRVPKEVDSKVVLDEAGAETLGGMGDGLVKSPEYLDIVRFQGFYKKS